MMEEKKLLHEIIQRFFGQMRKVSRVYIIICEEDQEKKATTYFDKAEETHYSNECKAKQILSQVI